MRCVLSGTFSLPPLTAASLVVWLVLALDDMLVNGSWLVAYACCYMYDKFLRVVSVWTRTATALPAPLS